MQVTETSAQGLKREFSIIVPAQDVSAYREERLKAIGEKISMPGFRPGKVPMAVIQSRYGKEVMGEVLEKAVSESSGKVIAERGLRPAGQPNVEIKTFDEGKDLEFSLAFEIIPEIQPMDFSKIALQKLTVTVPDQEIESSLARLAERNRKTEAVADGRAAQKGDVVVIDFVGRIGDTEFPGGSAQDYHLELGSGQFIPGFEDQLIGAKGGESRDVKVAFPADYGAKELAGKDAIFAVTVKEVQSVVASAIDDDLAKAFGVESLEALRKAVSERLAEDYAAVTRGQLKRQLLDILADGHQFELPAGLVEAEFTAIWEQVEADKKAGRLDPEDAAKSDDQLKSDYRAIAERRVRLGLLLAEVGRMNNIDVSKDELNQAVLREARRYPGQEMKVLEYYRDHPEAMGQLRAPIYEEKVIDFILELAKVADKPVTPEELQAILESSDKAA